VPGRRGNNEGSIYLRKDGLWVAAVSLPTGRRKAIYGRSRDEVRRQLANALYSRQAGTLTDSRSQTVGQFLDFWLTDVAKPSVRVWTYRGYEVHVRLHLKPWLGNIALDRLEPSHVQALLNRKLTEGLSPKSVRYIRGTLRTALQQAVRWGYLSRIAASLVDGPRSEPYEIKPLDGAEARQLLNALAGDRLRALYSVALTMGLRQGEALGLSWQDIDLSGGYIHVRDSYRGSMASLDWSI